MNVYSGSRSSRPAGLFSFGLLDVLLRVRLRRPHLREAPAGFGLSRLATASMNNPGYSNMFFILLRMPPSWSSGSPLLLAYSSSSSFCFGVSFVGISTFTRIS